VITFGVYLAGCSSLCSSIQTVLDTNSCTH